MRGIKSLLNALVIIQRKPFIYTCRDRTKYLRKQLCACVACVHKLCKCSILSTNTKNDSQFITILLFIMENCTVGTTN